MTDAVAFTEDLARQWLAGGASALVYREFLAPVEGRGEPFFPPTFAGETGGSGYNIDTLSDGTRVALVDSHGSQANRIEPLFKDPPLDALVPRVTVTAGTKVIDLLDAGHRAADAVVRFSTLATTLKAAFHAVRDAGDAVPLAKIAPTSLVFGAWDSRDTQAKLPRVLSSVIRAYGVEPLTRSAQYIPALDYVGAGEIEKPADKKDTDRLAEHGLSHVPSSNAPGGVIARGDILRTVSVNLAALRRLRAGPKDAAEGEALRLYLLGLALAAAATPMDGFLRQGCHLVRDTGPRDEPNAVWHAVSADGTRQPVALPPDVLLAFATDAARRFGVGPAQEATFDRATARAALAGEGKAKKARA